MGSSAGIAASLITFCRKTDLLFYIAIAEALDAIGDAAGLLESEADGIDLDSSTIVSFIRELGEVAARILANTPTDDQLTLAT